jgi:hypothetical protein
MLADAIIICSFYSSHITSDTTTDQFQNDQQQQPDQCITAVNCDIIIENFETTVANDVPMSIDTAVDDGDQVNSSMNAIDDAIRSIITDNTVEMHQAVVVHQVDSHPINDSVIDDELMHTIIDDDRLNMADECHVATSIIENEQQLDSAGADKSFDDEISKLDVYLYISIVSLYQ